MRYILSFLFYFYILIFFSIFSLTVTAFASPPDRIISLSPQVTELLYSIGLSDRIVAVTEFSDHPPEAKLKPKIGSMMNPSIENILALKPDAVVMDANINPYGLKKKLEEFKIKVIVFRADNISQLPEAIEKLGAKLDSIKKANKLAGKLRSEISLIKLNAKKTLTLKNKINKRKVIFLLSPNPIIAAGPGTPIDEALKILGWKNIASDADTSYPRYSLEELIVRSPDVILLGEGHPGMIGEWKRLLNRLSMLKAVKNGNICYMGDSLYQLGPEIIKGMKQLSMCLNGK